VRPKRWPGFADEHLADGFFRRDLADAGALAGEGFDQPFALQLAERFEDWGEADAHFGGDLPAVENGAGREAAGEQAVEHLIVDQAG
jgi:hypothetical protein